jgi:hypothetical protein
LSFEPAILQRRFSELLIWERAKRREQILISVSFYAVSGALLTLPLHSVLAPAISHWWVPLMFFIALAPFVFFKKRWRPQDATRALARVDRTLQLEARAITAWEIVARKERSGAEDLVVKQAEEKLKTFSAKTILTRQFNWHGYLVLPFFAVWLMLVWFDVGVPVSRRLGLPVTQTVAYKLREFSRELQEKAKIEGLRETLRAGQELEKIAQKGIDTKAGDERMKNELAGMSKKLQAMERSVAESPSFSTAETQESLKDFKTELEAARDLLNLPDMKGTELAQKWLDKLSALPQLKRQFDKQDRSEQRLSQNDLKSFLDKIEKQVTGELDRRTLLDAQQFLEQLMKNGQGQQGENKMRMAGRGEENPGDDSEGEKSRSHLPGKEPGKKTEAFEPLPEFPGGAPTHLKGLLDNGQSSGAMLKGKPSAGKSEVSRQEIVASYRRQAEAELNTERVPETLKESIRNYFLSLGMGEEKK